MNKQTFFSELRRGLSGLPADYVEKTTQYYSEMIDDHMEDGMSEEEAVAAVGPVDEIISQTVADVPLQMLVKQRIQPQRSRSGWEIALLIIGFPLWFPLLIAAGAILLSFYIVIWSLIISLYAVIISLFVSGVALLFLWIPNISALGNGGIIVYIGAGLLLIGISVLLFYGALAAVRGILHLTRGFGTSLKKNFIRKERKK